MVILALDPIAIENCHALVPAAVLCYLHVQIALVGDGHAPVPCVQKYAFVPIVQKPVVSHAVYRSSILMQTLPGFAISLAGYVRNYGFGK